jgi:hypothetical protein
MAINIGQKVGGSIPAYMYKEKRLPSPYCMHNLSSHPQKIQIPPFYPKASIDRWRAYIDSQTFDSRLASPEHVAQLNRDPKTKLAFYLLDTKQPDTKSFWITTTNTVGVVLPDVVVSGISDFLSPIEAHHICQWAGQIPPSGFLRTYSWMMSTPLDDIQADVSNQWFQRFLQLIDGFPLEDRLVIMSVVEHEILERSSIADGDLVSFTLCLPLGFPTGARGDQKAQNQLDFTAFGTHPLGSLWVRTRQI